MKINILYIIESMKMGGAEMVVVDLARRLDKSRFKPIVCSLSSGEPIRDILESENIEYCMLDKKHGKDLSIPFKIRRLIKDKKIDILHTHCQGPLLYSYLATRFFHGPRFIHTEHINLSSELSYSKRHSYYNRILLRGIDGFISISEHLTEYYKSQYKFIKKGIVAIPNGIDIQKFSLPAEKGALRIELGIEKNTPLIGNISTLRPQKDLETLIKAMKKVFKIIPEAKLIIAGAGELESELRELIKSLYPKDKVLMLGYRSDVTNLLSSFDVFVLPSLYEGLSICLLEASAVGTPIVTTDVPGNSELVRDHENGLLVTAGNSEKLAEAIIDLLNDKELAQRMSKNGRKKVEEKYDQTKTIKKYEQYYIDQLNRAS